MLPNRFALVVAGALALVPSSLCAQRPLRQIEWLAAADSLPKNAVTLVVVEAQTLQPVAHPMACLEDAGFMVGMSDGRLAFNVGDRDTVRLRILGPLHEMRAVTFPWTSAKGRAVRVELTRRTTGPIDPTCD
jgi:hypothetical protein